MFTKQTNKQKPLKKQLQILYLLDVKIFMLLLCLSFGLSFAATKFHCIWLHFSYRSCSLQRDQRDRHQWIPTTSLGHLFRCTCSRSAEEASGERRGNFHFCHYHCLLVSVAVMPLCLSPMGSAAEFHFSEAFSPLRCKNYVLVITVWVFWYVCSKKK